MGIVARYLRASDECLKLQRDDVANNKEWKKEDHQEAIKIRMQKPVSGEEYATALQVSFKAFQNQVDKMLNNPTASRNKAKNKRGKKTTKKGKEAFEALSTYKKNGIWCTQGRYGNDLGKIIGPSELPILPSTCVLPKVITSSPTRETLRPVTGAEPGHGEYVPGLQLIR